MMSDIAGMGQLILDWKERYSNIYYYRVGQHFFIFRLMTKGEYIALYLMQFHMKVEAEDLLLKRCVLYPESPMDECPAGMIASLIDNILKLSGFSEIENIKKDIESTRNTIALLDNQIILLICKAFPHLKPSDIDKFDYPTILRHIVLAEEVVGTKLEINKNTSSSSKTIDFEKENRAQGFVGSTPIVSHKRR